MLVLEPVETGIGQIVNHDGLQYEVMEEFTQGALAKQSRYTVFMPSPKGIYGLEQQL